MRLVFFLALIISLVCGTVFGQDPVFSQYYINSMHLNPAIAGSANDPRVFLHYRNQWPKFGKLFETYQASYDQFVKPLNGGIGINVLRDNIAEGIISSTNLDLIYSYRFKASHKLTFQAGLQASFNFFNKNVSSLSDNGNLLASQSTTQPNFGIGILGITKNSQIGLSVNHLNANYLRFNSDFVEAPIKISFFYARKFKIYDKDDVKERGFFITPAAMIQMQSASLMVNYGLGVRVRNVLAGVWMRTNLPLNFSAAIFSVGYAFDNITFGYSYDYNMLSLNRLMPSTGAHEITMVAIFPLDPKRGRYGPIKCPKAFVQ